MLLQDLVLKTASRTPDQTALIERDDRISYAQLAAQVREFADFLLESGLQPGERVGVYLNKQIASVVSFFGTALAGCVIVPINSRLKTVQVAHILNDCGVRVLVSSSALVDGLGTTWHAGPELAAVISIDGPPANPASQLNWFDWGSLPAATASEVQPHIVDADIAAIFYTSGSTGLPKGVVLSHRNIVAGAHSVAEYLENGAEDIVLAVLPLSFDAGFSQLTTMFSTGGTVVLMDYLLPQDVIRAVAEYAVTGLAGVPTLWNQLAGLEWPAEAAASLRYYTNTGGSMPGATLAALREKLPKASPYLMYGLTEAFRSTYLPPAEIDRRPTSIGIPIPNADIAVVRHDGTLCEPNEHGELVHRGALVAQGYWNNAEATAERFKPWPFSAAERQVPELAVWSGDTVYRDADGFLYFVARFDEMIKSSGFRISPTEVEACVHQSSHVEQCAAFGVPHEDLGQAVVVVYLPNADGDGRSEDILALCRRDLPGYMVPRQVIAAAAMPTTSSGKIDRRALRDAYASLFVAEAAPC